jgi:hypothetical protein
MKYVIATLLLWVIALVATILVVNDTGALMILGPLFAICMVGSVVIVRRAVTGSRSAT